MALSGEKLDDKAKRRIRCLTESSELVKKYQKIVKQLAGENRRLKSLLENEA